MAKIKIIGRREVIEVDGTKARQIKILRFGDSHGVGKVDPMTDIDLGDSWAGKIGQIDWIELDRKPQERTERPVEIKATRTVKMMPLNYELQPGEEFL